MNAKELALAKMNASIDLACMHLFLVVMGYTAEDVVKFTTGKEFSELARRMNSSKFNSSSNSVRKVLDSMLENYAKTPEEKDRIKMIRYIYDAAKEMSKIAKLGGINQGTKVDEIDANEFYLSFAGTISEQIGMITQRYPTAPFEVKVDSNGVIRFTNDGLITSDSEGIKDLIHITSNLKYDEISDSMISDKLEKLDRLNKINQERKYFTKDFVVDLLRYFNDEEYRNFCVEMYDFVKFNFNVFACMNSLPHFYEMLHAFVESEETIKRLGSRARTVLTNAKRSYGRDAGIDITRVKEIIHSDPEGGDLESSYVELKEVFDEVYYNSSIERKASKYYDDYILSEYLVENQDKLKIEYNASGANTLEIDLSTNEGVLNFCKLMAYTILPTLKEMYPDNTFLTYIRPDFSGLRNKKKDLYLPKYSFLFDVNDLNSTADLNKTFYINDGFVKLDEVNGERTHLKLNEVFKYLGANIKQGGDLSICELIYLYDKIVSSSVFSPGSLSRAFELYLSKASKGSQIGEVARGISQIILEHDQGIREEIIFDPVAFTAYCYSSQIRGTQDGLMRYNAPRLKGKKWLFDLSQAKEFPIADTYLFNLKHAQEKSLSAKTTEDFLKCLASAKISPELVEEENITYLILTSPADSEFLFKIPYSGQDLTVQGIALTLFEFSKIGSDSNERSFEDFLKKLEYISSLGKTKMKSYQSRNVYSKFVERMKQLGVQVETFKGNPSLHGYVENGVIYLNENSDITTTPIHELMHLVFGVMKYENFDAYEHIMLIVMKNKEARDLLVELQASGDPQYVNMMELDLIEEVLCRMIERISKDNSPNETTEESDISKIELIDSLHEIVNPYISKVFGIAPPKYLFSFLSDTIADLPSYDSTLFIKTKHDSTGYIDKLIEVIRSQLMTLWIEDQLTTDNPSMEKTKKLIRTDC